MGRIDLPDPIITEKTEVADKKETSVKDFIEPKEIETEDEKEKGFEEAEKLLSYKNFLDIKDDKEDLSYLSKTLKILDELGIVSKRAKVLKIKEIQYKIGGRPSIKRVWEYLRLENSIKNLVEKLRFV
ncbi:MAG: hypothetical protein QXV73_05350 [Candidatus Micrarchaeia archaeon]